MLVGATATVDNLACPVEVFCLSSRTPFRWRRVRKVVHVTGFVRDFYQFCTVGHLSRVFDLSFLSLGLGKRLVVRNLRNQIPYFGSERTFYFIEGRFRVFYRIVHDRRDQNNEIFNVAYPRDYFCNLNWMIDVGRCINSLAPLVPVSVGGELDRPQKISGNFHNLKPSGLTFQDIDPAQAHPEAL
jgi:hypothetical protein